MKMGAWWTGFFGGLVGATLVVVLMVPRNTEKPGGENPQPAPDFSARIDRLDNAIGALSKKINRIDSDQRDWDKRIVAVETIAAEDLRDIRRDLQKMKKELERFSQTQQREFESSKTFREQQQKRLDTYEALLMKMEERIPK